MNCNNNKITQVCNRFSVATVKKKATGVYLKIYLNEIQTCTIDSFLEFEIGER